MSTQELTNTEELTETILEAMSLDEVRERAEHAEQVKTDTLADFRAGRRSLLPQDRDRLVQGAEYWQDYLANREARAHADARDKLKEDALAVARSVKETNNQADARLAEAKREAEEAATRYADVIEAINDERAQQKQELVALGNRATDLGIDPDTFGALNGAASSVRLHESALRCLLAAVVAAFRGRAPKLLHKGRDREGFRYLRYFAEHETGSLKDAPPGPLDV